MTDEDAAVEVVRLYIEALVARDYDNAAKLYNGETADELRENAEQSGTKYIRFIATGKPVLEPDYGPRVYSVPYAYEIETSKGERVVAGRRDKVLFAKPGIEKELDLKLHDRMLVRPVVNQPNRWIIVIDH